MFGLLRAAIRLSVPKCCYSSMKIGYVFLRIGVVRVCIYYQCPGWMCAKSSSEASWCTDNAYGIK
jgi:hypothetical protein